MESSSSSRRAVTSSKRASISGPESGRIDSTHTSLASAIGLRMGPRWEMSTSGGGWPVIMVSVPMT